MLQSALAAPDTVNEMLRTRRDQEEKRAEWKACLYPESPSGTASYSFVQLPQLASRGGTQWALSARPTAEKSQ